MKNLLLQLIISSFVSCSGYSSNKYWTEENKAILDLMPKMVNADFM